MLSGFNDNAAVSSSESETANSVYQTTDPYMYIHVYTCVHILHIHVSSLITPQISKL